MINPDALAHYEQGNRLEALGRHPEALESYERAIVLEPGLAPAHNNRGSALLALNRYNEALASFDEAIALRPGYAHAFYNRGNALKALGRHDEALASFTKAVALKPDHLEALSNRGLLLQALGRHEEALASFDAALRVDPASAAVNWNKGLLTLLLGDLAEGWPLYEWRLKGDRPPSDRRDVDRPVWHGAEPLEGKTILLRAEQGFGDTIQFSRYVPLVAARGAKVVLEVQPALKALMATLDGAARIVARGEPVPGVDCQTPLQSLPLASETTLDTIPARVPYLAARDEAVARWSKRLAGRKPPLVGLVWSGRPSHRNDRNRSIALKDLLPLTRCGATVISLQKEARPADVWTLSGARDVLDAGPALIDFAETAAVVSALDLVISVDTSVAHLAGALGKPVWVLLPFAPDWRWLLGRNDSPWYPTARLFRQTKIGDWAGVVARVAAALRALVR